MRDVALSIEARRLLALMSTYSDEWNFNRTHLMKVSRMGKDPFGRVMGELIDHGYVVVIHRRDERGHLFGKSWAITGSLNDVCVQPTSNSIDVRNNRRPEGPASGKTAPVRIPTEKNTNDQEVDDPSSSAESHASHVMPEANKPDRFIKAAWDDLSGSSVSARSEPVNLADLIASGEGDEIEFKSTLRTNLHTGQVDEKMHLAVLKTIAGFLNAKGGNLVIGVADSGEVLGLEADGFPTEDKMGLHLVNLIKDRMGDIYLPYVHYHFEDQDGKRTLLVRCERGPKPAYVKDGGLQRFFVRGGASSQELQGASIHDYCKQRFG